MWYLRGRYFTKLGEESLPGEERIYIIMSPLYFLPPRYMLVSLKSSRQEVPVYWTNNGMGLSKKSIYATVPATTFGAPASKKEQ